ncbi:winged helix-turn-helix domain-containing protein [[Eubacterium] cellulosolvens]
MEVKEIKEFGRDFEMFGRRILHLHYITEAKDEGIIQNQLSKKIGKDSNTVRQELRELEKLGMVNRKKVTINGVKGYRIVYTLTDKGRILNKVFEQYIEFTPKYLERKIKKKINNAIERFYRAKTSIGKKNGLTNIKESIIIKISPNQYFWGDIPKLKKFLNDFLENFDDYDNPSKTEFIFIIDHLYLRGYSDEQNFEHFKEYLNKHKPEFCITELATVMRMIFIKLNKEPDNPKYFEFLKYILQKIKILDDSRIIDNSQNEIKFAPDSLKEKLFNELEEILLEDKEEPLVLIMKLMSLLSFST